MKTIKLSPRQTEVLKWLAGDWQAHVSNSMAVHINGRRVCNVDTMVVLVRLGLAYENGSRPISWKATAEGKKYYHEHK